MTTEQVCAEILIAAYRSQHPVALAELPDLGSTRQAYAVQDAVWRARVGSTRPSAWKVGAASRAAEPQAAPVFPDRLVVGPACLAAAGFMSLGIEAEIAFRFGSDLPPRADDYTRAEILAAIGSAHVAMELVDSRLADADAASPEWRLADNLLNGALVIGDAIPDWRDLDFSVRTARVLADGRELRATVGRPPLDDLFYCLPWWLRHVGGARPGDIVTTGAWNGMQRAVLPCRASVQFDGLGHAVADIR